MDSLKFVAEVVEVKSKTLASLDKSYRVVLSSGDPNVLSLGALDADTLLNVTVETE